MDDQTLNPTSEAGSAAAEAPPTAAATGAPRRRRAKRGRPTVWADKRKLARLKKALEIGMPRTRACHYAGISESVFFDRVKTDTEFSEWVNAREAEGIYRHLEVIDDVSSLEPDIAAAQVQASKFYLTTRGGGDFAPRSKVEHSGKIDIATALANALAQDPGELPENEQ